MVSSYSFRKENSRFTSRSLLWDFSRLRLTVRVFLGRGDYSLVPEGLDLFPDFLGIDDVEHVLDYHGVLLLAECKSSTFSFMRMSSTLILVIR